jgi:lysozyme
VTLSPAGLAFLEHEEGFKTHPYQDSAGLDTIGVGHLITSAEHASSAILIDGLSVPWRGGITLAQVQALFAQDCAPRETALTSLVVCPLNTHQWDALFSLYFNIGDAHFRGSTLLAMLNGGDWTRLEVAWKAWKFAGGKEDPVLVARRAREWTLFQTAEAS